VTGDNPSGGIPPKAPTCPPECLNTHPDAQLFAAAARSSLQVKGEAPCSARKLLCPVKASFLTGSLIKPLEDLTGGGEVLSGDGEGVGEGLLTVSVGGGGGGFEGDEVGGGGGGRDGVGGGVEVLELVEVLLGGLGSEGISELGEGGVGGDVGGAGGTSVEVEVGTESGVKVLRKD